MYITVKKGSQKRVELREYDSLMQLQSDFNEVDKKVDNSLKENTIAQKYKPKRATQAIDAFNNFVIMESINYYFLNGQRSSRCYITKRGIPDSGAREL